MKPLHNLWRDRKILEYSKIQLSAKPDNEKLKETVDDLEKKLANFEEQVAAFDAQAKGFEDRIYQQNQPPARKYQLVRLAETK